MLAALYVSGADRDQLDPILDVCVAIYTDTLGEEDQVRFKGIAKDFCRSYNFVSSILPYGHLEWEKLSIFLNFLFRSSPRPKRTISRRVCWKLSTWTATGLKSER